MFCKTFKNHLKFNKIFKNYKLIFLLILGVFCNAFSFAQESDTINKIQKDFKNSIKFNVSNTLIYDNSYQISYERIIKKNQSINVKLIFQKSIA